MGLIVNLKRFYAKARAEGLGKATRLAVIRLVSPAATAADVPLGKFDADYLLVNDPSVMRAKERKLMRATTMLFDASQVEANYPLVFEWKSRQMRYGFQPAKNPSQGLVVLFHGHNAFMHLGAPANWDNFDLLCPWDTFGWNRQGSWFWGEKGENFVEEIVAELIKKHRVADKGWFCVGASMGGFAALYHGIKYRCNGIYSICPQVDLRRKVTDYGLDNRENPYGYLQGEKLETVPDVVSLAAEQTELPPLFLVQNQFDSVNLFADHAFRLLDIYNRKQAWYGVRVFPAIGHGQGDASHAEAQYFFSLIVKKAPPQRYGPAEKQTEKR